MPRGTSGRSRRAARAPSPRARPVLNMRMASRREAVGPAVERVLGAAAPAGLDGDRLTDLAVALAEALSNAAVHGNRLDPRRRVRVSVFVAPGEVTVEVTDSGGGFDVSGVLDPTRPERRLVPGGRGVYLMRRLVDDVVFNEAGNSVRLTVRQPPSGGG